MCGYVLPLYTTCIYWSEREAGPVLVAAGPFWQPTLVQGVTLWLPKMVFKLSNLVPLRQFLARGTIFGTTKCSSGDRRGRIFGNQNRSSGIFGVIQQHNIFPFLSHRPELSLQRSVSTSSCVNKNVAVHLFFSCFHMTLPFCHYWMLLPLLSGLLYSLLLLSTAQSS